MNDAYDGQVRWMRVENQYAYSISDPTIEPVLINKGYQKLQQYIKGEWVDVPVYGDIV